MRTRTEQQVRWPRWQSSGGILKRDDTMKIAQCPPTSFYRMNQGQWKGRDLILFDLSLLCFRCRPYDRPRNPETWKGEDHGTFTALFFQSIIRFFILRVLLFLLFFLLPPPIFLLPPFLPLPFPFSPLPFPISFLFVFTRRGSGRTHTGFDLWPRPTSPPVLPRATSIVFVHQPPYGPHRPKTFFSHLLR